MSKKESDNEESKAKDRLSARERDELLIENFVGLQHAMTNLSIRFGALSDNINRLLQVFEEAARNIVHPDDSKDNELNKEMVRKIDSMLDQNKTIAQGLVAMEEKLRAKLDESQEREIEFQSKVSDVENQFKNKVSDFESRVSSLETRNIYPEPIKEEIKRAPEDGRRIESVKMMNNDLMKRMPLMKEPVRRPSIESRDEVSQKDLRQRPKPLPNI